MFSLCPISYDLLCEEKKVNEKKDVKRMFGTQYAYNDTIFDSVKHFYPAEKRRKRERKKRAKGSFQINQDRIRIAPNSGKCTTDRTKPKSHIIYSIVRSTLLKCTSWFCSRFYLYIFFEIFWRRKKNLNIVMHSRCIKRRWFSFQFHFIYVWKVFAFRFAFQLVMMTTKDE